MAGVGGMIVTEPMTQEVCATRCLGDNYQYMAIFDGTNCYCSNDSPLQAGATPSEERGCNDACPGDITQICGDGGNRKHSSVYRLLRVPPPNACAGGQPPPTVLFGHRAGNTGLGVSGGFSGSLAGIRLFRYPLDSDQVECNPHDHF